MRVSFSDLANQRIITYSPSATPELSRLSWMEASRACPTCRDDGCTTAECLKQSVTCRDRSRTAGLVRLERPSDPSPRDAFLSGSPRRHQPLSCTSRPSRGPEWGRSSAGVNSPHYPLAGLRSVRPLDSTFVEHPGGRTQHFVDLSRDVPDRKQVAILVNQCEVLGATSDEDVSLTSLMVPDRRRRYRRGLALVRPPVPPAGPAPGLATPGAFPGIPGIPGNPGAPGTGPVLRPSRRGWPATKTHWS